MHGRVSAGGRRNGIVLNGVQLLHIVLQRVFRESTAVGGSMLVRVCATSIVPVRYSNRCEWVERVVYACACPTFVFM